MTDKTIAFSLLDLAPIPEGSSARDAFSHSLDLARLAEKVQQPIIASGLLADKQDIMAALSAGAHAISTTSVDLWRI